MTERCSNCGAEFVAGQQFCRRCGAALRHAGEDAPTQLFPQGGPGSGPVGNTNSGPVNNSGAVDSARTVGTSPLEGGARTDAVGPATAYRQPSGAYPPSGADFQQTSPLVGRPFNAQPLYVQPGAQPARKSRRGLWLISLLVVFMLGVGAVGCAGYIIWRAKHRSQFTAVKGPGGGDIKVPGIPVGAGIPPDLGDKIRDAIRAAGVAQPLD
jgi:zinc-ribbon domain